MVKVVIGTKVCSFEEMLEEYRRVGEENETLAKKISELEKRNADLEKANEVLANEALERSGIFEIDDEEPFSDEECEESVVKGLEDRHMQDCITINQLQTTIDTLVDRYAKLREMKGL